MVLLAFYRYSHLLVSDFSGSIPQLPPEEMRNLMADPRMAQAVQNVDPGMIREVAAHIPHEVAARIPREVLNRNPLVVLLESILPWVDYGDGHEDNQDLGHDQGNEH